MKLTRTPRRSRAGVLAVALCMPALALAAGCTGRRPVEPTTPTASTAPAGRVRNPGDPAFGVGATADTLDRRTFLLNEAFDGHPSTLALTFTAEGALFIVGDCGQQRGNYRLTEDRLSIDPIPDGMSTPTTCTAAASAQLHDVLSALAATPVVRTNANMIAIVTDTQTFRLLERDPDAPPRSSSPR